MRINQLTLLGFYLNGAQGSGKYDDITIEEVKARIRDHTIFDYLNSKLGSDVDLSLLSPEEKKELNDEWDSLANAVDESRKMCVDRGGLCLLVAYLLEGIQSRARAFK